MQIDGTEPTVYTPESYESHSVSPQAMVLPGTYHYLFALSGLFFYLEV